MQAIAFAKREHGGETDVGFLATVSGAEPPTSGLVMLMFGTKYMAMLYGFVFLSHQVGGFLGVGERLVAVPFDKVKFVNEPIAYTGAGATNTGGAANKSSTTTTGAATGTTTTTKSNPWHPDHALFNATKDELKAMPEFKYSAE